MQSCWICSAVEGHSAARLAGRLAGTRRFPRANPNPKQGRARLSDDIGGRRLARENSHACLALSGKTAFFEVPNGRCIAKFNLRRIQAAPAGRGFGARALRFNTVGLDLAPEDRNAGRDGLEIERAAASRSSEQAASRSSEQAASPRSHPALRRLHAVVAENHACSMSQKTARVQRKQELAMGDPTFRRSELVWVVLTRHAECSRAAAAAAAAAAAGAARTARRKRAYGTSTRAAWQS